MHLIVSEAFVAETGAWRELPYLHSLKQLIREDGSMKLKPNQTAWLIYLLINASLRSHQVIRLHEEKTSQSRRMSTQI